MEFKNQIKKTTFNTLLKAFFSKVKNGSVLIEDTLVEAHVACYPFGEVVTIDLPGEHQPHEQIATKMGHHLTTGFSAIAKGETFPCRNCVSHKLGEAVKINIYRSMTDFFWSINSDKEGIVVLMRTYKDGEVTKMLRKYLPDNEIPDDILEQLNKHL